MLLVFVILVGVGFYVFESRHQNYASDKDISYLNDVYLGVENQKSNYLSRIISFDSGTTEGGELTVYFDKESGDTKIIEASYAGETFMLEYTYYFRDVNDFVILEKGERWDRPFYAEGRQKVKDEESKYYFRNLNMIQWVDSLGVIIDTQSEEFKQKEKEILQQLDKTLNVIKQ